VPAGNGHDERSKHARVSEAVDLRNRFSGGYVAFHTPRYLSLLRLARSLTPTPIALSR
jgi:hypothetical protein